MTLKALLRPEALGRVSARAHRYCAAAACSVVYFGGEEVFEERDLIPAVFHKAPPGSRTICYCLGIREDEVLGELRALGRCPLVGRIEQLVRSRRCACEVRNPEGACCLGNVARVTRALYL